MAGDIFTLDADNNAAVRTVSVNAGASETNSSVIFTTDENGNAAVRVMGGAGSVNYDEIIIKSADIPAAGADQLNKFYCYDGETNASYTHGYIYECVAGAVYYEANIAFDHSTFASESFEKAGQLIVDAGVADPTEVTGGTMTYALAGNLWSIVFTDADGNALNTAYNIYTEDLEQDYDILPTVDPSEFVDGQVVGMSINNIVRHQEYSWERMDVQPAAKVGRYLSGWNCATGLATTNPPESPYEYTTGDYFLVSAVATGGASNYKPNGSQYVTGQASTTVESAAVAINDMYVYDGTNWTLLKTGATVTSVNGQVGDVTITGDDVLPTQTGNSGKFLTTDGTNSSWSDKPLVNNATASTSVAIMGTVNAGGGNAVVIGKSATVAQSSVAIGSGSSANSSNATAVGYNAVAGQFEAVAIGMNAQANMSAAGSIALGAKGTVGANNACLINTSRANKTLSSAGVLEFCNGTGDYVLVNQDGTIPAARLTNALPAQTGHSGHVLGTDGSVAGWIAPEMVQRTAMPQASADEAGKIYQFTGTTDANYTNGYFYKCVSDGQEPATYSWTQTNVQPAPVIPDPLPSQTGNSGKFLTTDGTDASWATINALQNTATESDSLSIAGTANDNHYNVNIGYTSAGSAGGTAVGYGAKSSSHIGAPSTAYGYRAEAAGAYGANSLGSVALGAYSNSAGNYSTCIGYGARTSAVNAIQINAASNTQTNSDANTFKVGNANGNFELMDANGYIPAARLKNAATSPATMPTLAVADWSSNTQTVTVSGVSATNTVFVSPAPASAADYAAAGIICTAQGTDSLTFTCTTTPTNAITVNVVIIG